MRADRAATRVFTATIVLAVLALPAVVRADPPDPAPPAPTAPEAPPPTLHEAAPPEPRPRVVVEIPFVLKDSLVVVKARSGPVEGKLVAIDDDRITLTAYNGQPVVIDRTDVLAIRPLFQGGAAPPPNTGGWPAKAAAPPLEASSPPTTHDNDAPKAADVDVGEAAALAADKPKSSPWGFWGSFGAGPAWGQPTGAATPTVGISLDIALSYHFVYVGTGMLVTLFGGVDSFSNETTGGELSSGAPTSFGGYLEAGVAKGLFFPRSPTSAIEVRPGVGYGLLAMTDAEQGIAHCVDCDSRSFTYNGAHYVRFQLGVFNFTHAEGAVISNVFTADRGLFVGGTASFQQFVFGASPRLEHVLTFGLTCGWGS